MYPANRWGECLHAVPLQVQGKLSGWTLLCFIDIFSTGHTAVGFHLSSTDTLRRRRLHHSTRGHRRHFLYHQQRPGKVFCSHPAAQIKGGFLRKRFTAWMTEMSKQWRKWLYDGDNLLWCVALITITSFFITIDRWKWQKRGKSRKNR